MCSLEDVVLGECPHCQNDVLVSDSPKIVLDTDVVYHKHCYAQLVYSAERAEVREQSYHHTNRREGVQ